MTLKFPTCLLLLLVTCHLDAQHGDKYSLTQVIATFQQQYDVVFSYDASLLMEDTTSYQLPSNGKTLEKILDDVFLGADISYKVIDDHKVLIRKNLNNPSEVQLECRIFDATTGAPLPFASVFVPGKNQGTITDMEGNFQIEVSRSDSLAIQYLGYTTKSYNAVSMPNEIFLIPESEIIDEINIVVHPAIYAGGASDYYDLDGSNFINVSAVEVYGKDLVRSLQMLPGIEAGNDNGGELRIRGSQPDEVLVVIDGIPVYKIDHYYGIFGAVNSDYISNIKVYKNNLPIEEDSRTSGMVYLESEDKVDLLSGKIDADFMKINSYLETPLGDKMSLTLGGRFNHTDPFDTPLARKSGNEVSDAEFVDRVNLRRNKTTAALPNFNFYDVNGKWKWQISDKSSLAVSGLHSEDNYLRNYSDTILSRIDRVVVGSRESLEESENWKNKGGSVRYNYQFDARTKLKTHFYYSGFDNDNALQLGLSTRNLERNTVKLQYSTESINSINTTGFSMVLNRTGSFTTGFNIINRQNTIRISEKGFKQVNQLTPTINNRVPIDMNQSYKEYSLFAEKEITLSKGLHLSGGLKTNYLTSTENLTFSPQTRLLYQISSSLQLKGSYARLYQNVRELSYESRLGVVQNYFVLSDDIILPDLRSEALFPQGISTIYMLGIQYQKNDIMIDLEAYQKNLEGTLGFFPTTPGIDKEEFFPRQNALFSVFSGQLQSKGVDVLLAYNGRKLYSQLAYTYSKTDNRYNKINQGQFYPAENDRRHQLKWVNNYRWANFTIGVNTVYSSGEPLLSFENLKEQRNRREIDFSQAFDRLPNYMRWDFSASYEFDVNTLKPYISGSIYNVFNRGNVRSIQQAFAINSDANTPGEKFILGFESPLIQRLYNISVGIHF